MSDTGLLRTRAAEGLDRRAFSMADVEKMIEAGIIDQDEKFELIDGEIVPMMSPQAMPHVMMRTRIGNWLGRTAPSDLEVVQDATLLLAEKTFLEPDVLVFTAMRGRRYPRPRSGPPGCRSCRFKPLARSVHQSAPLRRVRRTRAVGGRVE